MAEEIKYEILQKERWTFLDARHNPVEGYRVTFRLDDGTTDWVDIRKDDYNAKSVKKAIQAAAKIHLAIV